MVSELECKPLLTGIRPQSEKPVEDAIKILYVDLFNHFKKKKPKRCNPFISLKRLSRQEIREYSSKQSGDSDVSSSYDSPIIKRHKLSSSIIRSSDDESDDGIETLFKKNSPTSRKFFSNKIKKEHERTSSEEPDPSSHMLSMPFSFFKDLTKTPSKPSGTASSSNSTWLDEIEDTTRKEEKEFHRQHKLSSTQRPNKDPPVTTATVGTMTEDVANTQLFDMPLQDVMKPPELKFGPLDQTSVKSQKMVQDVVKRLKLHKRGVEKELKNSINQIKKKLEDSMIQMKIKYSIKLHEIDCAIEKHEKLNIYMGEGDNTLRARLESRFEPYLPNNDKKQNDPRTVPQLNELDCGTKNIKIFSDIITNSTNIDGDQNIKHDMETSRNITSDQDLKMKEKDKNDNEHRNMLENREAWIQGIASTSTKNIPRRLSEEKIKVKNTDNSESNKGLPCRAPFIPAPTPRVQPQLSPGTSKPATANTIKKPVHSPVHLNMPVIDSNWVASQGPSSVSQSPNMSVGVSSHGITTLSSESRKKGLNIIAAARMSQFGGSSSNNCFNQVSKSAPNNITNSGSQLANILTGPPSSTSSTPLSHPLQTHGRDFVPKGPLAPMSLSSSPVCPPHSNTQVPSFRPMVALNSSSVLQLTSPIHSRDNAQKPLSVVHHRPTNNVNPVTQVQSHSPSVQFSIPIQSQHGRQPPYPGAFQNQATNFQSFSSGQVQNQMSCAAPAPAPPPPSYSFHTNAPRPFSQQVANILPGPSMQQSHAMHQSQLNQHTQMMVRPVQANMTSQSQVALLHPQSFAQPHHVRSNQNEVLQNPSSIFPVRQPTHTIPGSVQGHIMTNAPIFSLSHTQQPFQGSISTGHNSFQMAAPKVHEIPVDTCFLCGMPATIICCGSFVYCSKSCKDTDYDRHKEECTAIPT